MGLPKIRRIRKPRNPYVVPSRFKKAGKFQRKYDKLKGFKDENSKANAKRDQ